MINLEWLRTFSAIYECKSLTEASKRLNMTQPGVSKHLSALEGYLGKKLFERTTRSLSPTDYGNFYFEQISSPIKALEKVEYYSNPRTHKQREVITIGCTYDYFNQGNVQRIYELDMYIILKFGTERELIEALELDDIQLVLGINKHGVYSHEFQPLEKDELILICSNSINVSKVILTDENKLQIWLKKQIWFTFDNEQEEIKQFWNSQFSKPSGIIPRFILPSFTHIIDAVKNQNAVAVVPMKLCSTYIKSNEIQTPLVLKESLNQVYYYSFKKSLKNREVVDRIIEKLIYRAKCEGKKM